MYTIAREAERYDALRTSALRMRAFTAMMDELREFSKHNSLELLLDELLEKSGYIRALEEKDTEENRDRAENVRELKSSIVNYIQETGDESLEGYLANIALYSDLDNYDREADAVVMMTMHSAKGLEFPHVFLVGFEDGLFPGMRSIGDAEEMEEERRLCYVAITRAKESLTISHAKQRMIYGRTSAAMASRFLKEIPEECIVRKGAFRRGAEPAFSYQSSGFSQYPSYNNYSIPKKPQPKGNTSSMVSSTAPKSGYLELNKGDMVLHAAFGKGLVLSVLKMGGDALLEIAFDDIGTKKLMAKTASAHMKKL